MLAAEAAQKAVTRTNLGGELLSDDEEEEEDEEEEQAAAAGGKGRRKTQQPAPSPGGLAVTARELEQVSASPVPCLSLCPSLPLPAIATATPCTMPLRPT